MSSLLPFFKRFLVLLVNWFDAHFTKLDPAGVAFGAIGLNGEVAWSEVISEALGVLIIDDFSTIEPDLDMRAESFYSQ